MPGSGRPVRGHESTLALKIKNRARRSRISRASQGVGHEPTGEVDSSQFDGEHAKHRFGSTVRVFIKLDIVSRRRWQLVVLCHASSCRLSLLESFMLSLTGVCRGLHGLLRAALEHQR